MKPAAVAMGLALIASVAVAQDATVPGEVTTPYPTLIHLAVEWHIEGDDSLNGVVSVRFRPVGDANWRDGLPLRRVPAGKSRGTNPTFEWKNKHSGSLFDLKPNSEYEIALKLDDPDGGSAERTVRARTRPVPRVPKDAATKRATPETSAAALAPAQPGDILLLGPGNYAELTVGTDGTADKPLVLRAEPGAKNCYIADNVVTGSTPWTSEAMGVSGKNEGEGIQITGPGNVICYNRVSAFRDCISTMEDRGTGEQVCIDIYNPCLGCPTKEFFDLTIEETVKRHLTDAGHDGHKGPGHQVQLAETCAEGNDVQLITAVLPEPADHPDGEALEPMLDQLGAHGRTPEVLYADTHYGSDENVTLAARRAEQATDAFRDHYAIRGGGESVNSGLKRKTGLGRLRVRGSPRVRMAVLLRRAGWNVLRALHALRKRGIGGFVAAFAPFWRPVTAPRTRQCSESPSVGLVTAIRAPLAHLPHTSAA